jgi:hypothetical protein
MEPQTGNGAALRSDPALVHLGCQTHFYNLLLLYSTLCSRVKVGENDESLVVRTACGLGTIPFSASRYSAVPWGDRISGCGLCVRVFFMKRGICVGDG